MNLALLNCDLVDGSVYYTVCLLKPFDLANAEEYMVVSMPGALFAFALCEFQREISLLNFQSFECSAHSIYTLHIDAVGVQTTYVFCRGSFAASV